jgi:hypothetical protein
MIVESFKIALGGATELTSENITTVKASIDRVLSDSTDRSRRLIQSRESEFSRYASELSVLSSSTSRAVSELRLLETSLSETVARAREVTAGLAQTRAELGGERAKLFLLESIQKVSSLHCQIKADLAQDDFERAHRGIVDFGQLFAAGEFEKECASEWIAIIQPRFRAIMGMVKRSFSLARLDVFSLVLKDLNVCDRFSVCFFSYLADEFVPQLEGSSADVEVDDDVVSIVAREPGKPVVEIAREVFRLVSAAFCESGIEISKKNSQRFVEAAVRIAEKGTAPANLEQMVSELCDVAGVDPMDIQRVAELSRLGKVLGQCRAMLKDGRTLADVVREARTRLGGSVEGVLRQIVAMATVIWRGDRDKLSSAISTLMRLDPIDEAFECALLVERTISQM